MLQDIMSPYATFYEISTLSPPSEGNYLYLQCVGVDLVWCFQLP